MDDSYCLLGIFSPLFLAERRERLRSAVISAVRVMKMLNILRHGGETE